VQLLRCDLGLALVGIGAAGVSARRFDRVLRLKRRSTNQTPFSETRSPPHLARASSAEIRRGPWPGWLVAAVRADIAETEFRADVRERAERYLRVLGYDPEIPADKLSELVKVERLERGYRKRGGRGRRPR
jgi:hypothetical protein